MEYKVCNICGKKLINNLENFNYFGDEDLAALKSRNLKDSKKYVYDLVKWGIKQYIKQKIRCTWSFRCKFRL